MKIFISKIRSHKRGKFFAIVWGTSLIVLFTQFIVPIFAAPPTSAYNPGDTLNPTCAPGDTNCTVTPPLTGSSTQGYIPFYSASSTVVTSTASLFWDNTNSFLGVGTSTPTSTLHVVGTSRFSATSTFLANLVINGTITAGTWNGTTVGLAYGGTGSTTAASVNGLAIYGSNLTLSTSTSYAGGFTISTSSNTLTFNFPGRINDINNLATTTGNLIVASGTTWFVKTVGTDNYCLTASSTSAGGVAYVPCSNGSITSLNGLTSGSQTFATSGTGLIIFSSGSVHNFLLATSTINGVFTHGASLTFATSGSFGFSISTSSNTLTFTQATSTTSQSGFLSAADFTTFNAKQASITLATSGITGLSITSSTNTWTFTLATSTASVPGFLSAADFTTFNNKLTTSTAVTTGYFPYWGTATALTGTSSIYQTGLGIIVGTSTAVSGLAFSVATGTVATATSTYFAVNGNGLVGIGTSTPATELSVVGSLTLSTALSVANGGTGSTTAALINGLSIYGTSLTFATSGSFGFSISTSTNTLTFTQATSTTSQSGFLSAADFTTFNAKQASITLATSGITGLSITSSTNTWTFTLATSTASVPGFLSAADFTTFNNKLTTSTAVTTGYFPYWGTAGALTGTSSIYQSGILIGVGTTTPSTLLHLVGGAPVFSFTNSSSTGKTFQWRNGGVATTTFDFYDFSSTTSRLAIDTNGFLSIGTTTAAARFFVGSSTTSYLFTVNDSGNVIIGTSTAAASNALLTIASTTNTNILTVLNNGRVGIGTTTPSFLLDVTNASGSLLAVDGTPGPTYLLDIQNTSGSSLFTVAATSGAVTVALPGTGTANALCHTNQTGTSTEEIVDCTSSPAADYMEMYSVATGTEPGDLVVAGNEFVTTKDGERLVRLIKSSNTYQANILGIVSDPVKAGDFNSVGHNIAPEDNPMPVALSGRVQVKVSLENGPIKAGDFLAASSLLGIAMRATEAGMTIGMALQDLGGTTSTVAKILVFVGQKFSLGSGEANSSTTLGLSDYWMDSTGSPQANKHDSLIGEFAKAIQWALTKLGLALDHGVAKLKEIFVDRVTTKELTTKELCIGETCVNEDQLKSLINDSTPLTTGSSALSPVIPAPELESRAKESAASSTPSSTSTDTTATPVIIPVTPLPTETSEAPSSTEVSPTP